MRVVVCLLFALAAGFGTYALGAVIWASADPEHAGATLLFTIPLSIAAAAVPALIGVIVLIFRCDWRRSGARAVQRRSRSAPAPVHDDIELSWA